MKTTRTSRLLLAVPAAALAFALAACSGGAGGRPTADQIAEGIMKAAEEAGVTDVPQDQLSCITKFLYESDLSDSDLQAIADNKQTTLGSEEANKFQAVAAEAQTECVTQ